MTEHPLHPDEELVDLALGDVGEPHRSEVIRHLVGCVRCRATYEDITLAVDSVLPATPQIAPPVGFEQRVLTAMGAGDGAGSPRRQRGHDYRMRLLVAAAAAAVAAVLGGVVALAIWDDDGTDAPTLASDSAALRTADGDIVGIMSISSLDEQPIVVVSITRPVLGMPYRCEVILDDGRIVEVGRWTEEDPGGTTWIARAPNGDIVGMELVTDDGRVWSSAQMP